MRALDPAAGPIERFACELRALRAAAGEPPFWKMARRCEVSKSALADAVAGHRVPSENVVRNFVLVCGGDWPRWRERWSHAIAEAAAAVDEDNESDQQRGVLVLAAIRPPILPRHVEVAVHETFRRGEVAIDFAYDHEPGRRRRRFGLSTTWRIVIAGASLAGLATLAVVLLRPFSGGERDAADPASPTLVQDGTDPKANHCDDAVNLDAQPLVLPGAVNLKGRQLAAGASIGTVTLRFSRRCAGAWARFDPDPSVFTDPSDGTVTIRTVRTADGTSSSFRLGHLDQAYSDLLLIGVGCVQAEAEITVSGSRATSATGKTACLPKI
ncbi:DUF2690 domain-containing protein [Microtetraspora malaysiensis]|uniref:DUF2690 domain-containing protein n=1 Tax=Microtetraspora malaysiensis TaxID=161358 RepID=UPI003D8E8BCE